MNALSEYRRNAIEGKSGIGLVVVLYDALVGALYKGALAIKQGDIESRTKNLNQAIRIAGHLQATLDRSKGGEVAATLDRFYTALMREVLRASANSDVTILEKQISHVASLAEAWREAERKQQPTI